MPDTAPVFVLTTIAYRLEWNFAKFLNLLSCKLVAAIIVLIIGMTFYVNELNLVFF